MPITRNQVIYPEIVVIVAGPEKGSVKITRVTDYNDEASSDSHRINDTILLKPSDIITKLPKATRDFITAVRTHFGV